MTIKQAVVGYRGSAPCTATVACMRAGQHLHYRTLWVNSVLVNTDPPAVFRHRICPESVLKSEGQAAYSLRTSFADVETSPSICRTIISISIVPSATTTTNILQSHIFPTPWLPDLV